MVLQSLKHLKYISLIAARNNWSKGEIKVDVQNKFCERRNHK